MSVPDEKGDPPLWLALANNLEDIASTLVGQACSGFCSHGGLFVSKMDVVQTQIQTHTQHRSSTLPRGRLGQG